MGFTRTLTYINTVAIICLAGFWYYENYASDSEGTQTGDAKSSSTYTDKSVEEFLLKNPKIIVSSLEKYQDVLVQEQQGKQQKYIDDHNDEIYENQTDPRVGDPKAKIKIVEFFDYNCGYCKVMLATKERVIKERKDIEIVFKELPVLGEASNIQAQAALAVNQVDPKKYVEFHRALLKSKGEYKDYESVKHLAAQLGVDDTKFEAAYKDPKTAAKIKENLELAYALGIRGTPAYILDDQIIPGAVTYDDIVKIITGDEGKDDQK